MVLVCNLSQHYTNHCIRVSGITNFKRNKCSDRQVMAVSGHKSLQSLALYTRVCDDEKLMMGLKLTYSLLKPEEAQLAREVNQEQMQSLEGDTKNPEPKQKKLKSIENVPKAQPALMAPPIQAVNAEIQPHALDPMNKNILPLESALVPYQPEKKNSNAQDQPMDFDILDLLSDCVDDEQLVLAATQADAQVDNNSMTKIKLIGKKEFTKEASNLQWLYYWINWNIKHAYP